MIDTQGSNGARAVPYNASHQRVFLTSPRQLLSTQALIEAASDGNLFRQQRLHEQFTGDVLFGD